MNFLGASIALTYHHQTSFYGNELKIKSTEINQQPQKRLKQITNVIRSIPKDQLKKVGANSE